MMTTLSSTLLCLLTINLVASQSAHDCKQLRLRNVRQMDAGIGLVVAVDIHYNSFHLQNGQWYPLKGQMRHITVGPAGIWGIDRYQNINKYVAGRWEQTPINRMNQVDAGGDQFVVATGVGKVPVTEAQRPEYRNNSVCVNRYSAVGFGAAGNAMSKFVIASNFKYYSCGPNSCWAVNIFDHVFIIKKVVPGTCRGSNISQKVDGSLSMVEVATDGSVYGVNNKGHVFRRSGITTNKPEGLRWIKLEMCLPIRHVSYDLGKLWVVTTSGIALECPVSIRVH